MLKISYPSFLEDWWVQYTCQQFSCDSIEEKQAEIWNAIQTLSDLFTIGRSDLPMEYSSDPKLLAAYGLYFFPENYVRMQFIMQELLQRGWDSPNEVSVLDLGAGTGAASISIAETLSGRGSSVDITAVDQSSSALETSQQCIKDLRSRWPALNWEINKDDFYRSFPKKADGYDIIIFSFALNETQLQQGNAEMLRLVRSCAKQLRSEGLLIIVEPASEKTSTALEQLRDAVLQQGPLKVWAPCLHQLNCPLLQINHYWCHEVRRWNPPPSMEYLNRHLQRQIHLLKFSFLVLGNAAPLAYPADRESFRLVSPVTKVKGKWMWQGCAADGNVHEYQILKKDAGGEMRETIERWERGDVVTSR